MLAVSEKMRKKGRLRRFADGAKAKKFEIILVIVSFLGGSIVAPYAASFFSNLTSPKPVVQILTDKCVIVPMWGENWVLVKTVIKNNGEMQENNVIVRLSVESPWVFENNSTWLEYRFDSVVGNQAMMVVTNIHNPSVSQLLHGTFSVSITVRGATKTWDEASLSESW